MKKSILVAALVTVMSTSIFAGNEKGEINAVVKSSTKNGVYELLYRSTTPGTVTVQIFDAKGNLVLTDRVQNQNGFKRPYNFAFQTEGNYTIEVTDNSGKLRLPLMHQAIIAAQPAKVTVSALPDSKKYQVVMVGQIANDVRVDILDADSRVIFSDNISARNSFSKVYDLSQLKVANFTFEVKSQNQVVNTTQF